MYLGNPTKQNVPVAVAARGDTRHKPPSDTDLRHVEFVPVPT